MINMIKNISIKQRLILFGLLLGSLVIRVWLLPIESFDFLLFLSKWYEHIELGGGLKSLLTLGADYNLPYQYAMVLMTKLPLVDIVAIKLFSIFFDYMLAYFVFKIIHEMTKDDFKSLLSGVVALWLPTILMNSAGWGQSDSIYTAFLIATLYYIIKDKPWLAMLMYTISFGFKIQAVFLGPLMLILLIKKIFKIKHLIIPILFYLVVSIPILMIGGPITRILDIAALQVNIRDGFSFYLPNLFYLFRIDAFLEYSVFKIPFLLLFVIILIYLSYQCYKSLDIKNTEQIIKWSALFALAIPFFLVRMHERYYFPAEYIWLILMFMDFEKYKSRFFIILTTSTLGYITVSWWGIHAYSQTILFVMVTFIYPVLAGAILYSFTKLLLDEQWSPKDAV